MIIEDPYVLSMVMLYSIVGALARSLVGIYKSWRRTPGNFRLDVKKLLIEFCTSSLVGAFGVVVIDGLGLLKFSFIPLAMLGGLLGSDTLNVITKKVGLTKGLDIVDMNTDTELSEFNDRQANALSYLKNNERITNKDYQKLNQTTLGSAKWDLAQLVGKRKLKKVGMGKATYYKLS